MGIIFVLLIAASRGGANFPARRTQVPTEVVLACHVAMGLGTLFGGWRIVKTMGQRHHPLRPVDGFCAEAGAAADPGADDLRRRAGQHDAHDHRVPSSASAR